MSRDNALPILTAAVMVALWACLAATLPAFPVDETRYLTVAWEMRQSGQWLLPTLNGEPYSHKPPLLFWLVNAAWTLGGQSVWAARLVPLALALLVFYLTGRLAARIFPADRTVQRLAPALAVASPLLAFYGSLIMFDSLLSVAVLASLVCLWDAACSKGWKPWILFGLAMGAGVLAKGPVVLLHMAGPALLAPFFWLPPDSPHTRKGWYARVLAAVGIAVGVGLCWAVPAALTGGPEFARMIFWEQSAGRMVNSFAHRRPVWFYLPFLLLMALPWLFNAALWKGLRNARAMVRGDGGVRFLLCWFVPGFVAFSVISGKQVHYLLPLVPALALFAARSIAEGLSRGAGNPRFSAFALPYALVLLALAAAPLMPWIGLPAQDRALMAIKRFDSAVFILGLPLVAAAAWIARGRIERQGLAMLACTAILFAAISVEATPRIWPYQDLRPLEKVLKPYRGHPVAFIPKYAGEIGFTARLAAPVAVMEDEAALPAWFQDHPDGLAVIRHEDYETLPQYDILYSMPYRGDQRISVARPHRP